MRVLLLFVIIHDLLRPVESVNGVIWNRKTEDFVPIFSVPTFAAVNQERLSKSRKDETHNFHRKIIRFSYYEQLNLVNSEANGTRISGAIGEIWNMLSEFLNFTLLPIRSTETTLGHTNPNGTHTGLLGVVQRNETDAVPRVEAHIHRLIAAQFTLPLWKTNYYLYIRRDEKYIPTWMLKLFSRNVWLAVLATYILLSLCNYLTQAVGSEIANQKPQTNLNDYFFYHFGMICDQSYMPNSLCKSSSLIELWLGLFSCLIRTAYGALLIRHMTQISTEPPFDDLHYLLTDTSYYIYAIKGSLSDMVFRRTKEPNYLLTLKLKRYIGLDTEEEVYQTICSPGTQYAVCQSEDIKKARGIHYCRLNPSGAPVFDMWIVSGIARNLKYKRAIDLGILKLYEVGFMKLLKHRWIESKNEEDDAPSITEPITMEQVNLMLYVFQGGLLISFVILLLENLIFYCNKRTR